MTRTSIKFILPCLALSAFTLSARADDPQPTRLNEVLVQSSPLEQSLLESAQPVTVLDAEDLQIKAQNSLGETLASEPGISSSYFGPGASRPIIRGLGGDRIRILENGIGSQDVSNTSPDHASNIDPNNVDKIEVIRGPASLLYGTSAVGGIVNIFDNRIPEELPEKPVTGNVQIKGATVDKERGGTMSLTAPAGPFALHFDGGTRRTDDYDIPGFARTKELRETAPLDYPEPKGKVPFSATDNDNLTFGSSYIFEKGFLGAAVSEFNTNYGVPNGEENISIDGQRHRLDVRGKVNEINELIKSASLKFGAVNYDHTEFEGTEPGTKFSQDGIDGRLEFTHQQLGAFNGSFGFQVQGNEFKAIGEEAFQPPTESEIFSAFVFEDITLTDSLNFQLGTRYDYSDLHSDGFEDFSSAAIGRNFDTLSESAGLVWKPQADYALALSLAHTERAPSGQELFADGPHIATGAFEIGNPDLDTERSLGLDLNFRKESGPVRGFIGGFYNRFWDYINLSPNGATEDDLPVFLFEAIDADFIGFESQVAYFPIDLGYEELSFDFQPDYVHAANRSDNDALPRIPPLRMKWGANYFHKDLFRSRLELQHVFNQDRTAEFETTTDNYTFLNAYLSKEIFIGDQSVEFFLRGSNLLNDKARDHTSFIKDVTPLPGASVMAGVRFLF